MSHRRKHTAARRPTRHSAATALLGHGGRGPNVESVLWRSLLRLGKQEDGQNLIEYAFVLALIALGTIASVSGVDGKIRSLLAAVGSSLVSAN